MKQSIKIIVILVLLLFGKNTLSQFSEDFRLTDTNIFVGQRCIVGDYYFDFTKFGAKISEESIKSRDSIIEFLKSHPNLIIELGHYTDQRGSTKSNLRLSQNLVDKFKIEIINRGGINWNRIIDKGYGEGKPSVTLDSIMKSPKEERDKLHQQNRRFEIIIISDTFTCNPYCINNVYGCDSNLVKLDKKYSKYGNVIGYDSSYSILKEKMIGLTIFHSPIDSNIITNVIYYTEGYYFNQDFILFKNNFRSKSELIVVNTLEEIRNNFPLKIIWLNEFVTINILYNEDYTISYFNVRRF